MWSENGEASETVIDPFSTTNRASLSMPGNRLRRDTRFTFAERVVEIPIIEL